MSAMEKCQFDEYLVKMIEPPLGIHLSFGVPYVCVGPWLMRFVSSVRANTAGVQTKLTRDITII